ncbi:unnamed protein product, partial [Effrenium voratum]
SAEPSGHGLSRPMHGWPWLLTLLPAAHAQGFASLSYTWLSEERLDFCRDVLNPPPKLDETAEYPLTPFDSQVGAESRVFIQGYRRENLLIPLARACPLVDDATSSECSTEAQDYLFSLLIFGSPLLAGLFFTCVWQVCCCTAMCRCCRRCCLCSERKAPRPAAIWQKAGVICLVPVIFVAASAGAFVAYTRSETLTITVSEAICHSLTIADETLNGSPSEPLFLGVDAGIKRMSLLRQLLDVDGKSMTDIRAILDETAAFGSAMEDLLAKVDHMKRVLTLVGQQKLKEHSCWFCTRAAGSNVTGEVGLLNELLLALQQSSADAMQSIRQTTAATLTGKQLVDVTAAVQRGNTALQVFKQSTAGTFVEAFLSLRSELQGAEDARHTAFMSLSGFALVMAILANLGAIIYARRSKAKYPSATPSCVSWFCGFCVISFGLAFAGLLLLLAVPVSEMCGFMRYELLTHQGVQEYYRQVGLFNPQDPAKRMDALAADVFRSCFTGNGTGDMVAAMQLQQPLAFQEVLDARFVELEDKQAGMVVDTARYELLVTQAQTFGGLFLLDPDQQLPLDATAAPKLLGSSLDPDDQVGPDGESLIYGLNTSIAGAGQYSFAHGTSGGGVLITATQPSEASLDEPQRVRNALAYARLKEQILSEPFLLRCDVMDSNYIVTAPAPCEERQCSFEQFKAHVLDMAEQVKTAGLHLGNEANSAKQLLALDLRTTLQSILTEVRELRTLLGCRFLWRRWEDFDFKLCNVALPAAIEAAVACLVLAVASLLLAAVHYKMWRHLLDNKVLGEACGARRE